MNYHTNVKFCLGTLENTSALLKLDTLKMERFLSKQNGYYATLEDFFACILLQQAQSTALPVPLITGETVFVPNIVEDAFYLSQQVLERAFPTLSDHAIFTVVHRIVEMWKCDDSQSSALKGVYEALRLGGPMLDMSKV